MNDIIRQWIVSELAALDEEARLISESVTKIEAQGFRVVEFESGDNPMKVWDYRTKEILGTWGSSDPWPDQWWHIDGITDEIDGTVSAAAARGLPDGLMEALREWVGSDEAEARAFVGKADGDA